MPRYSFHSVIRIDNSFNVESTDIIIGGDYNIDLLKISISDNLAVQFYNTVSSLSMVPTITRPTRIARNSRTSRTSSTLLDNFLITNLRNFKTGILRIDITDHLPIFLIYELYFDTVKLAPKEIEYRVVNELTLGSFYSNFSLLNMHDVLSEPDVSSGVAMLHEKLLTCYNESIPLKKKVISVKDQLKPWITPVIKSSIKRRHHYFSLYKQNRMSKQEYNTFRNRLNNEIRYAKKDYYHRLFQIIKNCEFEKGFIFNFIFHRKQFPKVTTLPSLFPQVDHGRTSE